MKCKKCHGTGQIEAPPEMQQGMVCDTCGHGWWSFDMCCHNPKPTNEFVEQYWRKLANSPNGDER